MSTLFENIKAINRRICKSAMIAERDPSEVKLVAVSKTVPVQRLIESANYGIRTFGESRVQEALSKIAEFESLNTEHGFSNISWHMIGTLQKNKVKTAVALFDLIHSVDSVALAYEIDKHALKAGKVQRILLQVKLSPEDTKHGIAKQELLETLAKISEMKNLKCEGLMTLAPYCENPEDCRGYFRELKDLLKKAKEHGFDLKELSMGMSHDFEVAIEEGATIVRIGTALFNARGDPTA